MEKIKLNYKKRKLKFDKLISIVFIIAFLLFIILITSFSSNKPQTTEIEFPPNPEELLYEDIRSKFPDAEIELINVEGLEDGNKIYTFKLVYYREENDLVCPLRYHVKYIYPKRGFANLPRELIFDDCNFCKQDCNITLVEQAIVASFNRNYFVRQFVINSKPKPKVIGKDGGEVFEVIWDDGKNIVRIKLDNKGKVLEIKEE